MRKTHIADGSGGFAALVAKIRRTKRLTPREEADLVSRAKAGSGAARDRLIEAHLPIALKLALSRTNGRPPVEDVLAEATTGLIVGIDRFDPSRGVRISHVAAIWARDAVDDFMLANASLVRIPDTTLSHRLNAIAARIPSASHQRFQPDMGEVARTAATIRCGVDEMVSIWVARQPHATLDDERVRGAASDDKTQEDLLVANDLATHRSRTLRSSIGTLPEREADLFSGRHLRDKPEPYRDLAERHRLSRERARQINQQTFEQIRRLMERSDSR